MSEQWLAAQFEENRARLRDVACRMLGSPSEADDAVQEAWLRFSGADTRGIENLGGWLKTVVARVCLDALRARRARREEPLDAYASEPMVAPRDGMDPESEALLADSVGAALVERVALVLHDMFDLPFDEIAPIVGRTPTAARKLASRARRRVRGAATTNHVDPLRQREVVDAFLAASRAGDFEGLLAVLDPDVVFRADRAAVRAGAPSEVRGAARLAESFAGRARAARLALVDGAVGLAWAPGGKPRGVFRFTIAHGKIVAIDMMADPERVDQMDVVVL